MRRFVELTREFPLLLLTVIYKNYLVLSIEDTMGCTEQLRILHNHLDDVFIAMCLGTLLNVAGKKEDIHGNIIPVSMNGLTIKY